ncbi:MAG: hypothetical protein A2V67_19410 [Deltaproteobacteria bacterium RBG_13_61_14]|nr:MAG: hypothetical protein A2V67_19410 [Deltaproteobacteria bacterium RBG_13_61_14]
MDLKVKTARAAYFSVLFAAEAADLLATTLTATQEQRRIKRAACLAHRSLALAYRCGDPCKAGLN